jgi:DNA-binding response OmpR family regulator
MAKKILIIDNDFESSNGFKAKLEEYGYTIINAKDGVAGMHSVHIENPDLIILKHLLPNNMNGCQLCSLLKRDVRYHEIPIIMIFICSYEDLKYSIAEPPDCILRKPINFEDILNKIKELMTQSDIKKEELNRKLNEKDAKWIKEHYVPGLGSEKNYIKN